jgi:iron(III) transport system ATP-binding protein
MSSSAEPAPSGTLVVEGLEKVFPDREEDVHAVADVSFRVDEGQFYTLLGPSGCGKTTTLRCVAGLEHPNAGRVELGGQTLSADRQWVPPHRRDIGMVFQSYAIWPHMTVFENVAFPLRVLGTREIAQRVMATRASLEADEAGYQSLDKDAKRMAFMLALLRKGVAGRGLRVTEIARRVQDILRAVGLAGLESRNATQLSGGQQQRLALARALVRRPKLLLLDEPLSNLDATLRDRMRSELRSLQRQLGVTTLYVTHDQTEALSMSTRIAVMSNGRIVQEATPRELYMRPSTKFVAEFVGSSNFMSAEVIACAGGLALRSPIGVVHAECPDGASAGDTVTFFTRPENIRAHAAPPAVANAYEGTVEEVSFVGEALHCQVRVGPQLLSIRQHPSVELRPGSPVHLELPPELCTVLPADRPGD